MALFSSGCRNSFNLSCFSLIVTSARRLHFFSLNFVSIVPAKPNLDAKPFMPPPPPPPPPSLNLNPSGSFLSSSFRTYRSTPLLIHRSTIFSDVHWTIFLFFPHVTQSPPYSFFVSMYFIFRLLTDLPYCTPRNID